MNTMVASTDTNDNTIRFLRLSIFVVCYNVVCQINVPNKYRTAIQV